MSSTIPAVYLLVLLVVLFIIAIPSAIIFIAITEDSEAASIPESELSGSSVQQATLNQEQLSEDVETVSLKEEQPAEQEIPEEYRAYIENTQIANKFLEENPKFTNIIKSIDEQGVNIVADDVSFYIEFNEKGFIEGIAVGTDDEYKRVVIHGKLSDFLGKAQNAENAKQFLGLVSDMDIPIKYYLKIPEIISLI